MFIVEHDAGCVERIPFWRARLSRIRDFYETGISWVSSGRGVRAPVSGCRAHRGSSSRPPPVGSVWSKPHCSNQFQGRHGLSIIFPKGGSTRVSLANRLVPKHPQISPTRSKGPSRNCFACVTGVACGPRWATALIALVSRVGTVPQSLSKNHENMGRGVS